MAYPKSFWVSLDSALLLAAEYGRYTVVDTMVSPETETTQLEEVEYAIDDVLRLNFKIKM